MAATTMLLTMIWMMDLALRANPVTLPLPLLAMRPPVMGKGGSDVPAPAQPLRLGWDGSVGRTLGATLLHKTFSWTLNPFVSRRAVSETARENRGTSAEPSPARENAFSLFFFPFTHFKCFTPSLSSFPSHPLQSLRRRSGSYATTATTTGFFRFHSMLRPAFFFLLFVMVLQTLRSIAQWIGWWPFLRLRNGSFGIGIEKGELRAQVRLLVWGWTPD